MRRLTRVIFNSATALWTMVPDVARKLIFKALIKAEGRARQGNDLKLLCWTWHEVERQVSSTAAVLENGVHPKMDILKYEDFFIERIADGEVVLDIGCGIGRVSFAVAQSRKVKVWGIDNNPQKIEIANSNYMAPNLKFLCADAFGNIPLKKCDVVILSNVLEHIEDRSGLLRALAAGLRPERILVRVPLFDRHWLIAYEKRLGFPHFSDDSHVVELTREEWLEELEGADLEVGDEEIRWGELWCECAFPRRRNRR